MRRSAGVNLSFTDSSVSDNASDAGAFFNDELSDDSCADTDDSTANDGGSPHRSSHNSSFSCILRQGVLSGISTAGAPV